MSLVSSATSLASATFGTSASAAARVRSLYRAWYREVNKPGRGLLSKEPLAQTSGWSCSKQAPHAVQAYLLNMNVGRFRGQVRAEFEKHTNVQV